MSLQSRSTPLTAKTSGNTTESWSIESLDMRSLGGILQRQWYAVLLSVLIFTILSIAAFLLIKPRYEAQSQVLVEPPKHRALSQDDKSPENPQLDSSVVDSQISLILSNRNLAQVATQEHLADDAEFTVPGEFTAGGSPTPPGAAQNAADQTRIDPRLAPVIDRLAEHLDVARVGRSNVVAIKVRSLDPQKSARLADLIAETYVADQVASRVKLTQQAASLFADRLDALRTQVRSSENALAAFRRKNGLATTSDEKITVSDQLVGDLNERLSFASSDAAAKRARYDQATRFAGGAGNLSTLPDVVKSPAILQLQNKMADAERTEADNKAILGNAHPEVIRLEAQVEALRKALTREVGRVTVALKNDYLVAKSSEAALQKQVNALVLPAGAARDAGVELRELERTNLANKALFENFLERAKLTQEESSFEVPESRLISPALAPIKPDFPKLRILLPAGVASGLIFGMLMALLLDMRRPTIRRSYQAKRSSSVQSTEGPGQ